MPNCTHCNKPLNRSVYKTDATGAEFKSCPRCSTNNGAEHVFHPYPDAFGTTDRRTSGAHPEGPQSYCASCRGGNPPAAGTPCSAL